MKRALPFGWLQSPVLLLVVTGSLLGLNMPLGKIAGDAGISPLVWAMIVSLGVCLILLPVLLVQRRFEMPKGRMIRYVIISALISFVIPNSLLFSVIPRAGAGFTGLMFALSPVFTLMLAIIFRLKTPNRLGLIGIAIGFLGAAIVSVTRGSAPEAPQLIWIVAALAIPLTLACGNVYRTIDWPQQARPDVLAFWGHAISAAVFISLILMTGNTKSLSELSLAPVAAWAQMLVAGIMFPIFFRLQQIGGPVLLSQIGYVAAAVGLVTATVLLGEQYRPMTWLGALVIAVGIVVTIIAQSTRQQIAIENSADEPVLAGLCRKSL